MHALLPDDGWCLVASGIGKGGIIGIGIIGGGIIIGGVIIGGGICGDGEGGSETCGLGPGTTPTTADPGPDCPNGGCIVGSGLGCW